MRRTVRKAALLAMVVGLMVAPIGQVQAVPDHLHCVTTPSGETHSIARGVTFKAPHEPALHNVHEHVHLGAFLKNPIQLTAHATEPFTCPPS